MQNVSRKYWRDFQANIWRLLLLLSLSGLSTTVVLAEVSSQRIGGCERATRPTIPDGSVVSKTQLLEAKTRLEKYLLKAESFLACVKRREESLGEKIDGDRKAAIIITHNAVVDEMYLAGDEFNVALRKFNHRENP